MEENITIIIITTITNSIIINYQIFKMGNVLPEVPLESSVVQVLQETMKLTELIPLL